MTTYVVMGNAKYYDFIALNIARIRKVEPRARVLVYDWGDDRRRPAFVPALPNVEVVDWTSRISDVSVLEATTTARQRVEMAISFNARYSRSLRQRMRKAILKRWPTSWVARPLIRAGLTFENMLLQKVPCMLDASARTGDDRMIFLDADALLLRPVEDLYDTHDFDVAVTLIEQPNWAENQCSVINSGVIFFGSRPAGRHALLSQWQTAIGTCTEWLREQTALVRMLNAHAPGLFSPGKSEEIDLGGEPVRLLALSCAEYNNTDRERALAANARVLHLANTAHNLNIVGDLLTRVSAG